MSDSSRRGIVNQKDAKQRKLLRSQSPSSEYSTHWDAIERVLEQIHNKQTVEENFETTYRRIWKVVLIRRAEKLFADIKQWHDERLRAIWFKQMAKLAGAGDQRLGSEVSFFQGFMEVWESYWQAISVLPALLSYLERSTERSLLNECMKVFLTSITTSDRSSKSILHTLTLLTYSHEYVEPLQSSDLTVRVHDAAGSCFRVIDGLCEVEEKDGQQRFRDLITKGYLERVRGYYEISAKVLASRSAVAEYCFMVGRWLLEEECRCHTILPRHMNEDLRTLVIDVALEPHLSKKIREDTQPVFALLDDGNARDIERVYRMGRLTRGGTEALNEAMEEWLAAAAQVALGSDAKPEETLLNLIRLDIKAQTIHREALDSNSDMKRTMDKILGHEIRIWCGSDDGVAARKTFEADSIVLARNTTETQVIRERAQFYYDSITQIE
ncbi:Cullin repeat-like-containing domain protein [Colletotrichum godetiae]|uniref:Cullin repeat-like-containing domain protein n=1 Tax=Colletotrichum godetiae TaxID=1209918 RepID=A0AAJ0AN96_9PEZI|nr:Cullin repeat-like-containing domain protein [Colletotrichum godetiae]KAK1687329.1 Cullin repeat-like-containing domain protein [Colletotrichum godetiae]